MDQGGGIVQAIMRAWGAADEASLAGPPVTSCCAAQILTGHRPAPVCGLGTWEPLLYWVQNTYKTNCPWPHSPLSTSAVLLHSQDSEMLPTKLLCTSLPQLTLQPSPRYQKSPKPSILSSPMNNCLLKKSHSPSLSPTFFCSPPTSVFVSHSTVLVPPPLP